MDVSGGGHAPSKSASAPLLSETVPSSSTAADKGSETAGLSVHLGTILDSSQTLPNSQESAVAHDTSVSLAMNDYSGAILPVKKIRLGGGFPMIEPKMFYRAEEEEGKVQFIVIRNDNTDRNMIWLVNLKEIFAKQLPKMPREYIVRLLFDRYHQSLLCLEGDQVVGGISFKPYNEQRFGEIAFCAVSATHQVKGYGTRLMNHLKEYVKQIPLTHFLTYADNFAIGYFKKQGFSSSISMPKERWKGYIKDYDGGTLMECVVHPQIDYFRIPELVSRQRSYLLERIADSKKSEVLYQGLGLTRIDDPYAQIPGLKEAGWTKPLLVASSINPATGQAMIPVASLARALVSGVIAGSELQAALKGVIEQVANHKEAWPFHEPVPASVVDYLEIIKQPMDLSLIRRKLESKQYFSPGDLRRDLQLMLDNCKAYNRPDTSFYKAALGLQRLINDIFGEIPAV